MKLVPKTVVLIAALFTVLSSARAAAQNVPTRQSVQDSLRREAEQRLGRSISNQEVIDRIRQSGMSRSQARTRLQQLGYDPALADVYFDRLSMSDSMGGVASRDFIRALVDIGLMEQQDSTLVADSTGLKGQRVGGRPPPARPD